MPERFSHGQEYRKSQLAPAGTVAEMPARAWGWEAYFETRTPCCGETVRIDARKWAGVGAHVTCKGCRWKWEVLLAYKGQRLGIVRDPAAGHPAIRCDTAEWVSRGFGVAPRGKRGKK